MQIKPFLYISLLISFFILGCKKSPAPAPAPNPCAGPVILPVVNKSATISGQSVGPSRLYHPWGLGIHIPLAEVFRHLRIFSIWRQAIIPLQQKMPMPAPVMFRLRLMDMGQSFLQFGISSMGIVVPAI
jgi:hypothetical protein